MESKLQGIFKTLIKMTEIFDNLCVISYHFVGDFGDGVRVVHPPSVIGEPRPDVNCRFLVPVGQEVVEPVVRQGFDRNCRSSRLATNSIFFCFLFV